MKFFNKRKAAIMLILCGILNGKNNFASGLSKTQKAGVITVSSILGLGISAFVGYKIYRHFNPSNPDDPDKKDDKNKKKELFSQDEVKNKLKTLTQGQKGDKVILIGGVIGTIVGFKDNLFEIKISENTKITVLENGIVDVFKDNQNGVSKK